MHVHLTLPVHNEERTLRRSVGRVVEFLAASEEADRQAWAAAGIDPTTWQWEVVIAENGSQDRTLAVAEEVARQWNGTVSKVQIQVLHRRQPGRGGALQEAWLGTEAELVSYMDVDLSSDLADYPRLLAPLVAGEAEVAIGSRLAPGAQVRRGWKREMLSRVYNRLVRFMLHLPVWDTQCGFKAMRAEAARTVLAEVEDRGWFWDTELLWVAYRKGMRMVEVPIRWVEDPDSRVRLLPTMWGDLRGLWRLWRQGRRAGAA